MKISIILGTRPEIIKMAPVIRACEKRNLDYFILHSNQHYSYNLDKIFFRQLQLPEPKYNLEIGSSTHGKQTGQMLIKMEPVLINEKPDIILVEGDTNTVLAGALTARKLDIGVGHVEAGLRSFDRKMPEENNRILTDHISDYLFAPSSIARQNLLNEGIPDSKIFITGNTIVDAIQQNQELFHSKSSILNELNLKPKDYFLLTVHRQENTDDHNRLFKIVSALRKVIEHYGIDVVYPIHPRTRKMLKTFNIKLTKKIRMIEPVGYLELLHLQKHARLILTDSGGVQEESCILQVPCVTLRDNTERPETLDIGSNILAGVETDAILQAVQTIIRRPRTWVNPFGDGAAAEKIIMTIEDHHIDE